MSLQWRPAMAIDNGIIDHDHKVLISIINDFIELKPHVGSTAELQRTLARLYHYANTHFKREESLQNSVGYSTAHAHKELHVELSQRLDSIFHQLVALDARPVAALPRVANGPALAVVDNDYIKHHQTVHKQLSGLLRNWILEHILKHDLTMRDFVGAMNPFAAKMPSLWSAKPASLAPNVATPHAARQALNNAKTWMNAKFLGENEPAPSFTGDSGAPADHLHPVIARLAREAAALGMAAEFDLSCREFRSPALQQVYRDVVTSGMGAAAFDVTPSNARQYLRQVALFERSPRAGDGWQYRAIFAGKKFTRIFGDIADCDLAAVKSPDKFARWKLLIDGVLELNVPLRLVSVASAFDRDDLAVERLFVPLHRGAEYQDAVLVAASYDIALD